MIQKQLVVFVLLLAAIACNHDQKKQDCETVDISKVNRENVIRQGSVTVIQTMRAIHDSLAPDLLLVLKDQKGNKLKNVNVALSNGKSATSDSNGEANFIAFAASNGIFDITIKNDGSGCFVLTNLSLNEGEVRGFDVIISDEKAN